MSERLPYCLTAAGLHLASGQLGIVNHGIQPTIFFDIEQNGAEFHCKGSWYSIWPIYVRWSLGEHVPGNGLAHVRHQAITSTIIICKLDPYEHTSLKWGSKSKTKFFKCRLQNVSHFVNRDAKHNSGVHWRNTLSPKVSELSSYLG